jgi:flagellar protein FliS
MNAMSAIAAYKDVGLDTDIMGADPHKLVAMLYDGALLAISRAKSEIQYQDIEAKGEAISKAIAIIGDGLQVGLDINAGGDIAQNLFALYGYMVRRLVTANATNDVAILDEITRLLSELQEAWATIRPQVVPTAPAGERRLGGQVRA